MTFRFSSINLGCSKNLVDLEFAIGEILKFSNRTPIEYYEIPEDEAVEYVLVNTCGFLSSAREESENTLRYFDDLGKKIILMGCYISVKDDHFLSSLKHLHAILPFTSYAHIEQLLFGEKPQMPMLQKGKINLLKDAMQGIKEEALEKYLSSIGGSQLKNKAFVWKGDETRAYIHAPFGYEYLKIAEGCDNNCTFCIIPKIRGRQKSREIEDILQEVGTMIQNGISEIEIIAQDTTRYGTDISSDGNSKLFELLEKINAIPGDFRFRIFYLYPDTLTLSHLKQLQKLEKFIPYFDIPFQHYSAKILKLMGRCYDQSHIHELLAFIRGNFPGAWIRTSFIIGFPGETNEDFNELISFITTEKFESVGIFEYHDEPLAASFKLPNKVSDMDRKVRLRKISKVLNTLYDERKKDEEGMKCGGYIMDIDKKVLIVRREIQAPEIDEYDEIILPHSQRKQKFAIGEYITYTL